jgi:hypothetical protein
MYFLSERNGIPVVTQKSGVRLSYTSLGTNCLRKSETACIVLVCCIYVVHY